MSEEQLAALLAKLKDDVGLQEKLKGAADLDAVLAIAKEAGFDISKAAWLRYQANQTIELSDEELEGVCGGGGGTFWIFCNDTIVNKSTYMYCAFETADFGLWRRRRNFSFILSHLHPCHHRGFYLSKHPQKPQKQHPILGTISHLHCLS